MIEKLANFVLDYQRDFFLYGPLHIKPITMVKTAELLKVSPSTISRAVNDKFIETKWGTFQLNHFFCESLELNTFGEISSASVKEMIKNIIENENSINPISDSQIAIKLEKNGVSISRRTVSKYRQELSIPSQKLRKRYV